MLSNTTGDLNTSDELVYLLTPRCRVLLEKLTGLRLVKKFPAFYGTRRFITALTSVRHLSLPRASPNQSTYPYPTSWRSILILSTHLHLVRDLKIQILWDVMACPTADCIYQTTESNTQEDLIFSDAARYNLKLFY